MFKFPKFLTLSIIIAVLIVAGALAYMFLKDSSLVRQELPEPDYEVKEYSLGGEVLAIDGDTVTIKAGRVFVGKEGNYVDYEEKKVILGENTKIGKISNVNGQLVLGSGTRDEIVVGGKITAYSTENIVKQNSFTPDRIDIIL